MLTGHIDVVPPGPAEHWHSDPFVPEIRNEAVYGRGAVDMKGGVACMLMAVELLQDLNVQLAGDVVFTTVVDERSVAWARWQWWIAASKPMPVS